jgi:hypothetical protein
LAAGWLAWDWFSAARPIKNIARYRKKAASLLLPAFSQRQIDHGAMNVLLRWLDETFKPAIKTFNNVIG